MRFSLNQIQKRRASKAGKAGGKRIAGRNIHQLPQANANTALKVDALQRKRAGKNTFPFQSQPEQRQRQRRLPQQPSILESPLNKIIADVYEDPLPVDIIDEFDAGWPDIDTLAISWYNLAYHALLQNALLQTQQYKNKWDKIESDLTQLDICVHPFGSKAPPLFNMTHSITDRFITGVADLIADRDGEKLQDFLQVNPESFPSIYLQLAAELKEEYPGGSKSDAELLTKCEKTVSKTGSGTSWAAFPLFMRLYLTYLRDVNTGNPLETYNRLRALLNQCVLALGDSQLGVVVLPTVFYLSKILANLAIHLDQRPELIADLLRQEGTSRDEAAEKITLVEQSANVVREAFIKCLTDKTGAAVRTGKPEGKRVGIYQMANLCLKLFFRCGKLRNAEQMFASINAHSPPLDYYPASQRVTFLYYLGRYLFSNNLFHLANKALQAAYDQCHTKALRQKHLILTYLIACNIIMGRFPSEQLLRRPEAQGLAERFFPLCQIIVSGDYLAFRQHLQVGSNTAEWFGKKKILYQLRHRSEILVWVQLVRKVFIYGGFHGDPQVSRAPPPFLHLSKLGTAVKFILTRHSQTLYHNTGETYPLNKDGSATIRLLPDSDFDGVDGLVPRASSGAVIDDYTIPDGCFDAEGQWQDNADNVRIDGKPDKEYNVRLNELNPYSYHDTDSDEDKPSTLLREIESILASLLMQGLLRGYLTHKNPRFVIPGARQRGALPTGFPNVWQTINARETEEGEVVPGWVRPPSMFDQPAALARNPLGAAGGGRVVNLKGARPVGVQ